MKEIIIDAAGKTWQFLGHNGEIDINVLPKKLKQKNDVVFQSLGWLAREDKIKYTKRDKRIFVSLIDSEMQLFSRVTQNTRKAVEETEKSRKRTSSA